MKKNFVQFSDYCPLGVNNEKTKITKLFLHKCMFALVHAQNHAKAYSTTHG